MAWAVGADAGVGAGDSGTRNDATEQAPIQARPGGPENAPRRSQEVPVTKGTRLVLDQQRGRGRRQVLGPRRR